MTEILFPKVFALNDRTHTWTFDSGDPQSSYNYNSNFVTVDDSGARPVDSWNKFSNSRFAQESDLTAWNLLPISGSSTPEGWVPVPGSSDYNLSLGGTPVSGQDNGFLVMKYEAKAWDTQAQPPAVVADGFVGGAGQAGNDTQERYRAKSTPEGKPWVNIGQTYSGDYDANEACNQAYQLAGLTEGTTHLISNSEWMTISRNVEQVDSNWTNGEAGNGALFRGNSNGAASLDGTDPLSGINTRTHSLNSGEVVWDMAGNVWNWTSDTILGQNKPDSGQTAAYVEWTYFNSAGNYGTLSYNDLRSYNDSWKSSNGIGQYYMGARNTGTTYAFRRGGHWITSPGASVFALALNNEPSTRYSYIGFRCASDAVEISQSFQSTAGRAGSSANNITIGSLFDGKLVQSINVGDTAPYQLSAYVSLAGGGEVNSSVAVLYYNGEEIIPDYTREGETNWYLLSASVVGADEEREFGVLVRSGREVLVDDLALKKEASYSLHTKTAYFDPQVFSWDSLTPSAEITGDGQIYYQICLNDGDSCSYSGDSRWLYYSGGEWVEAVGESIAYANSIEEIFSETEPTPMQSLETDSQKIAVKVIFSWWSDAPSLDSLILGLTTDTVPPGNISAITMKKSAVGSTMAENEWTNNLSPYFGWDEATDNEGGSGIKGYCLFITLGDSEPNLQTGLSDYLPGNTNLDEIHISSANTDCGNGSGFLVAGESINFANVNYRGSSWLVSSTTPYYLWVQAVDNAGNMTEEAPVSFHFRFDNTAPTNVSYISPASGSFSNVNDMSFSWPTAAGVGSTDNHSGILGWQYRINTTSGPWLGVGDTHPTLGVSYIPLGTSTYMLTEDQDGGYPDNPYGIVPGNNVVYFRTIDNAGNFSSSESIRTGNLQYGGAAPSFIYDELPSEERIVTVTPDNSEVNLFALSWPQAQATVGQEVATYYYIVNELPPTTLATLTGNPGKYISNGDSRTVAARALPNVNKGNNEVWVVAVDTADNYSYTNRIKGTFYLDSSNPDNVGSLVASDSSIKSQSQWNVTLTWTAPIYQGAGNLSYVVYRSSNGTSFEEVGTTSGLSYVDNTPSSSRYYYKVVTKDGANLVSSGTNAVSITPTGRWTEAPALNDGPDSGSITTKKAVISWSTSRNSDSKVQFGTSSNNYFDEEPSNSSQVTSHKINLTGLNPGTKYYYRVKWTDEDGNTGTSDEKFFTTMDAPNAKEVGAKNISLSSALIEYTTLNTAKVKIYYGKTVDFGGVKEVSTSTSETTYTTELSGLDDGTKYYYKINTFDADGSEYEGNVYSFETLPRPRISNVRLQQVANTAQSTILVSWNTNTEVSSIVTYYPLGDSSAARDEVNVTLKRGEHQMIIRSLSAQTDYILVVKGRDKIGNEASSEAQRFTTATDTRPPQISSLRIEGSNIPPVSGTAQESTAQLIVSWNTDEPATSQVEFGEGTGKVYAQKTQEDSNLKMNHIVIITNLTPAKVYHLRALSRDAAGNTGNSIDTVTITPKATENALNLVITNLQEAFGFLGGFFNK